MSPENELILSFYKEAAYIDQAHQVSLVQHVETGEFFVKKIVSIDCLPVCTAIKENSFPSVPQIIQLIDDSPRLIIIEEYIHGKNLEKILAERLFSEKETVHIILKLCEILMPLHQHVPAIIHRDIKPSNLILEKHGNLYLIDFDASKAYDPDKKRDTVLMGTTDYAAPEQYGFQQSDQRTDIYSIGVLMNKMLTGRLPSESMAGGILGEVIRTCTALDPDNRFPSCRHLSDALKKAYAPKEFVSTSSHKNSAPAPMPVPVPKKKKLWQHILLFLTAAVFTAACLDTDFTNENNIPYTGYSLWVNRIGFAASILLTMVYFSGYFNLRNRFPWKKKSSGIHEILRLALGGFICFCIPVLFVVFLE